MRRIVILPGLAVALLTCASARVRADEPDAAALDERVLKEARLAVDGPSLLEFFRKRTISNTDLERIGQLIRDLGDDSFELRQKASAQERGHRSRAPRPGVSQAHRNGKQHRRRGRRGPDPGSA